MHGHFYQPPRENAWLEEIEKQDSAFPWHDWNERISAECYGPNGASRILNNEQKIIQIVNNYGNISFNFGPTLLSWMEKYDTDAYRSVIKADLMSRKDHRGHGNAIAQVYNHIIMPLAGRRDKETQIIWGIRDFIHRFGRDPEGMWLAETAVDTETLELLSLNNIQFTILAPRQAKAIRKSPEGEWLPVGIEENLDTTIPYICKLPSGRSIALFFYNGKIAREVAFNGLLNSGKLFAERLLAAFDPSVSTPQLVHIATDGETYGHHHYRGDMALASCIDFLQREKDVVLTNYAEYLQLFPPQTEIQIHENSSWSCVHGVERWRSNCGCTDGGHPEFHQRWREPLRNALNWLRDHADAVYEKEALAFTSQPWQLRNNYIEIILNRNDAVIHHFFETNCSVKMSQADTVKMVRLLEMERHALLMFTSCGWFFDEVSRIETKQILQYADRVIQIAEHETGVNLFETFVQMLSLAPSNIEEYENAAVLYEKEIRTQRLTLTRVGMNHAILSLFEQMPDQSDVFNYHIRRDFYEKINAGEQVIAIGKISLVSKFTYAEEQFHYAALYLGQHNVIGGYAETMDPDDFEELFLKAREAFRSSDLSQVIALMRNYFGDRTFSFKDLFTDEQERLINGILQKDVRAAEDNYRDIYDRTYTLVNMLHRDKKPIPELLKNTMTTVVNAELKNIFAAPRPDINALEQWVDEANAWKIPLEKETIAIAVSGRLAMMTEALSFKVHDLQLLDTISKVVIQMGELGLKFRLWKIQNKYFTIGRDFIGNEKFMQSMPEAEYQRWLLKFKAVGEQLNIRF